MVFWTPMAVGRLGPWKSLTSFTAKEGLIFGAAAETEVALVSREGALHELDVMELVGRGDQ